MAVFVDPFLLTLVLIFTIVLIIANLYFIAHYSHHADSAFGSSSFTKFFVMLGFVLVEAQLLMLPLDMINYRDNTNINMFTFWQIIYMSCLFFITIVLPFAYFFYETDEDENFKTKFCLAFRNTLFFIIGFCCIHFPMYSSMRHSFIPVESFGHPSANTRLNDVFIDIDSN